MIEVDHVGVVHLRQVALVEGHVDTFALLAAQQTDFGVVFQGRDVIGKVAHRGLISMLSQVFQDATASLVGEQIEYDVFWESFLLGRRVPAKPSF
jgi:hypothetical protein